MTPTCTSCVMILSVPQRWAPDLHKRPWGQSCRVGLYGFLWPEGAEGDWDNTHTIPFSPHS